MKGKYRKAEIFCIVSGIVLYILTVLLAHRPNGNGSISSLTRAGPGDGTRSYELWVKGLEDNKRKTEIMVDILEKQYSAEEAETLFEDLAAKLPEYILGQNSSLSDVQYDLDLEVEEFLPDGIRVHWESEEPERLDSFGKVYNETLGMAGCELYLKAFITDGVYEREYDIPIHVNPLAMTASQQLIQQFREWLALKDEEERTTPVLELPELYEGKTLTYGLAGQQNNKLIPVIGIICALFLAVKEKNEKQEEIKKREQLLLLDYSEVISKLVVLLGAGMTIRLAWERITDDYIKGRKGIVRQERPAYEEMLRTAIQLKSGASESRAYSEFGKRCALQPYLKLGALLEQNQKTGSKNLKACLELEMVSAFEERKNLAKRLGEEAGTKLLLPLFLLLGIVMVMIVVPAFLTFF